MNRIAFEKQLLNACKEATRTRAPLSLLFVDLDGFKPINDTLGHAIGDVVLQDFAQCLQRAARASDAVARLGGDEFVIICPELGDPNHIHDFCDRLFAQVARITVPHHPDLMVGASVGVATFPRDAKDPVALLERADAAMYCAKRQGGEPLLPRSRVSTGRPHRLSGELAASVRGFPVRSDANFNHQRHLQLSHLGHQAR